MISLNFDTKDFERILRPLAALSGDVDKAVRASVKRTADSVRAEVTRDIKAASFLQSSLIRKAVGKPSLSSTAASITGEVLVAGKPVPVDKFRLIPRRVTARKNMRSKNWPLAGYQIGPREKRRRVEPGKGKTAGFVVRRNGRLKMLQRAGQGKLERVFGYAVQYFAAFDATVKSVESKARATFERRLAHEINYRLGKLK